MKTYILLTLAILFWAGNFIFARLIHFDIPPFMLALLRWGLVFLVLLPYLLFRRNVIFNAIKNHFFILFIFSALGIAGFNTFLYYGVSQTTAINALLINSSIPIFIIILNAIFMKELIKFNQILGIALSTLGVLFLITQGNLSNIINLEFNQGDLWVILSSLTWAIYSILLRYKPKNLQGFDFMSIIVFMGFMILLFAYPIIKDDTTVDIFNFDIYVYIIIIYMVIFPSLLSFYFWNKGVLAIGANKTGQFIHLMPLFGFILAYFIVDERLLFYHLYGALFVGAGIYLSLFYKPKTNNH